MPTSEPFELAVVCPHYRESLHWAVPLLETFSMARLYLADCGVSPVPAELRAPNDPNKAAISWTSNDREDTHTRHALRIALRNHLRAPQAIKDLPAKAALADIMLAI